MNEERKAREILFRKPNDNEINSIYTLLTDYAKEGLLLQVEKKNIAENLNAFIVALDNQAVIGCAMIRDFENKLYEIRSLAVSSEYTGQNIGTKLVKSLIDNLPDKKGSRIFALTYRATFFENLGFTHVDKELFPQKIWSDCSKCPKQDNCDEEALMVTL